MKNIKSLFSLAFYRDTLSRIRTFGIIIAIIFTALPTLESASYLMAQITAAVSGMKISSITTLSLSDINSYASPFVTVIVPIMTIVAFSFLMKRSESDFYEAIPVNRCAMAVSGMLAVFTSAIFVLSVSSLFPVLVLIPCMGRSVSFLVGKSFIEFLGFVLASALAISAATIAVSVTGTVRNAVLTAAVIIGVPRAIMGIINSSLAYLNASLVQGHIIPIFDNNYNLLTAVFASNNSALFNPWSYLYTALLFIAYAIVAVLLFMRRKSEFATHSFANKAARHAVRIAIATLFSMLGILVICIDVDLIFLAVILFMWSVAVYFIYELVTGKRENTFVSSLVTLPIFVAVNICLGVFIIASNSFFTAYSPSSDEIESVAIVSEPGELMYMEYDDYVILRSENISLDDENSTQTVARALDRVKDGSPGRDYQSVIFKIKTSGGTAYRRLYISQNELKDMNMILAEQLEYESLWLDVSKGAQSPSVYAYGIELEEEASRRILEAAESEIHEMGFARWYEIYTTNTDTVTSINYNIVYNGNSYTIYIPIFESMTKTFELYEQERTKAAQAVIETVKTRLSEALSGEGDSVWLGVTYFGKDNYLTVDEEISPSNERASALVAELVPMISAAPFDYDGLYVSLSLYDEQLFSESIYIDLAVTDGVSEESLIEFFKKYGYEY